MELPVNIDRVIWDDWNRAHIATHGITTSEAETVLRGSHVQSPSYKQRILVLGPAEGRILAVIVGPVPDDPGAYYPFSARAASRQERRYYYQQRGGATE